MTDGSPAEHGAQVYHYAACRDCPRFKWVDSQEEALAAAREHHHQYQHSAYPGRVPSNAIGYQERHAEGYNDE